MDKNLKRCEACGWIDVARNACLRGYIKRGTVIKDRYVGKYGVGARIKSHVDGSHYNEVIRTVQTADTCFSATFCKNSDDHKTPLYKTITVMDVHKKNDGYYCKIADGITGILTNDWALVECDVWEVLGV